MTEDRKREWATEVARLAAYAHRQEHGYLPASMSEAEIWQPHEWVISALIEGYDAARISANADRSSAANDFAVAVFTEGDFAGLSESMTEVCADAYVDGVTEGAAQYGSRYAVAYVLPRDADNMKDEQRKSQFERAMEAYAEQAENRRLAEERD